MIALSVHRLGPSGGFFLVPPRKKERMRLKGGAVGKAALLKNSSGLKTNVVPAPPSGEYGVQSLMFSRSENINKA